MTGRPDRHNVDYRAALFAIPCLCPFQKHAPGTVSRSRFHCPGRSPTAVAFIGIGKSADPGTSNGPGPDLLPPRFQHALGDPVAGRDTFRYEIFGNQGFCTAAAQLPQGLAALKLTPLQALQLGLSVNIDASNDATKSALTAALQQVQAGTDPAKTAFRRSRGHPFADQSKRRPWRGDL